MAIVRRALITNGECISISVFNSPSAELAALGPEWIDNATILVGQVDDGSGGWRDKNQSELDAISLVVAQAVADQVMENSVNLRALALATLSELNVLRDEINTLRAVHSLSVIPQRTTAQLKTAIENNAG